MQPQQPVPGLESTIVRQEVVSAADSVRLGEISTVSNPPLPVVPGYIIREHIGQGGMGIVYLAEQERIGNRLVALKTVRIDRASFADVLDRFLREIAIVGTLNHPNIVSIFDSGETDEFHYFAMEYIPGESLHTRLTASPISAHDAAEVVCTLARAMEYAHRKGVIHRDLKPGNIMIGTDGTLKILDFGIARLASSDKSVTRSGGIVGTPHYMSPEQASGRLSLVSERSDIYSLCAILYRALTGSLPFDGESVLNVINLVARHEPVAPRTRCPSIPRDLETICLTGMEKEPSRRYQTAQALADDLQRFLGGTPILARPVGLPEKCMRWTRRNPSIAALSLLVMISFLSALVLFGMRIHDGDQELVREAARKREMARNRVAQEQRLQEEELKRNEVERAAQRLALRSAIQTASHEVFTEPSQALRTLNAIPKELKFLWEVRYLVRKCKTELLTYSGHSGPVWSVRYSPDGTRVASVGSGTNTLCVWNAEDGEMIRLWSGAETSDARCVAFLSDNRIAIGSSDGTVRILSVDTATSQVLPGGQGQGLLSLTTSRDGRLVAAGSVNGVVTLWDMMSPDSPVEYAHGSPVTALSFTPDRSTLLSGGMDSMKVWNVKSGESQTIPHPGVVRSLAVAPDGERIFSAGDSKTVYAWDKKGENVFSSSGHTQKIWSLDVSSDGTRLISGGDDKTVRVWNCDTGDFLFALRGHESAVTCIASHPTMLRVVTAGSSDKTARIWDVASGNDHVVLKGHEGTVTCVAAHPSWPSFYATGGFDRTIRIWNEHAQEVRNLSGHTGPVNAVTFTSDGTHVVSGSDDGTVKVWEIGSGECVATFRHGGSVKSVAMHADGKRIVAGGDDGMIRICDPKTRTSMLVEGLASVRIWSLCCARDGTIISGCDDGMIRMSESDGKPLELRGHKGPVRSLLLSGNRLFSGGTDGVIVWDIATKSLVRDFRSHGDSVLSLACTDDGTRLFTGGSVGIRVLDALQGTEVLTLPGTDGVQSLAVCKDGQLVFVGKDSLVRVISVQ